MTTVGREAEGGIYRGVGALPICMSGQCSGALALVACRLLGSKVL